RDMLAAISSLHDPGGDPAIGAVDHDEPTPVRVHGRGYAVRPCSKSSRGDLRSPYQGRARHRPPVGLDAIRDIAVAGGKIVAVEADIAGDAPQTIDARGKIVAPGLIDIHTHASRSKEGPALLLQDGVTGWVDAGSAGADNIDQIATVART